MNARIDKVIRENSEYFDRWVEILNKQIDALFSRKNRDNDEFRDIILNAVDVYKELSHVAIKAGAYRDSFDTDYMGMGLWGPYVEIKSNKTGQTLELGTDVQGIYLHTHINNAINLKYMDDEFWMEFFELKNFEGFEDNLRNIFTELKIGDYSAIIGKVILQICEKEQNLRSLITDQKFSSEKLETSCNFHALFIEYAEVLQGPRTNPNDVDYPNIIKFLLENDVCPMFVTTELPRLLNTLYFIENLRYLLSMAH